MNRATLEMAKYGCNRVAKEVETLGGKGKTIAGAGARKGAQVLRKAVKAATPSRRVKKAWSYPKGEKNRPKGKKVYYFAMKGGDAENSVLQLPIKNPGSRGGNKKAKYGYLPSSLEYGFMTSSKDGGYRHVDGSYFVATAAEATAASAHQAMIDAMEKQIDKEWKKRESTGGKS